jgi:hypothetical protein
VDGNPLVELVEVELAGSGVDACVVEDLEAELADDLLDVDGLDVVAGVSRLEVDQRLVRLMLLGAAQDLFCHDGGDLAFVLVAWALVGVAARGLALRLQRGAAVPHRLSPPHTALPHSPIQLVLNEVAVVQHFLQVFLGVVVELSRK